MHLITLITTVQFVFFAFLALHTAHAYALEVLALELHHTLGITHTRCTHTVSQAKVKECLQRHVSRLAVTGSRQHVVLQGLAVTYCRRMSYAARWRGNRGADR